MQDRTFEKRGDKVYQEKQENLKNILSKMFFRFFCLCYRLFTRSKTNSFKSPRVFWLKCRCCDIVLVWFLGMVFKGGQLSWQSATLTLLMPEVRVLYRPPLGNSSVSLLYQVRTYFQNKLAEVLRNPFPKKLFSQNLVRIEAPPHYPNTWRAEPQKEKCPFHFRKNPPPRKSKEQGTFFFLGLPSEARRWRGFRGAYDLIQSSHALRACDQLLF